MSDLIVNRYRLQQPIGQGAMGTVYQALDDRLGKIVAVKFLAHTLQSVEMCDRFEVEAKATAQLSSRYIVSVIDYGVDQSNRPFYVMEYLQGRSLKGRMRPYLPLPVFLNLTQQICLGLQCAHEGIRLVRRDQRYPVIHCDLKPSNIFVISEPMLGEEIRILDFGIASLRTNKSEQVQGFRGGTLPYCSPEQLDGQTLDPRSDLYSLGIVMFEMLTGKLPVYPRTLSSNTPTFQDWHQTHQTQTPLSLTKAAPDRSFPQPLSNLILQCLTKKPDDRPQSATEVFEILRELGLQFGIQLPRDQAVDQPIPEIPVQNQPVILSAGQRRSSSTLIWRGPIKEGKILAKLLFSGSDELASLWCMLPRALIKSIQIHQQYTKTAHRFLFAEYPQHPMLLWLISLYIPKRGFVWLHCYLDLKQPANRHLAQLLSQKAINQVLFFDLESPNFCSHTLNMKLNLDQCDQLKQWIVNSHIYRSTGAPAASKERLEAEYRGLKPKIEEQLRNQ